MFCIAELGDYDPYKHTAGYVSEYRFVPDQKEELEDAIEQIHKTLVGQVPAEAEMNYLGVARTLEMYGVDLHPVYGESKSEYFLGLTPVGVVVFKNKRQVGKYFWPRITKVHFKETQFELRVLGKDVQGVAKTHLRRTELPGQVEEVSATAMREEQAPEWPQLHCDWKSLVMSSADAMGCCYQVIGSSPPYSAKIQLTT
ncbi:UNVERIFIED_CONTAM: hypothetical protein K2H54_056251 [Gekko kuhli]